MNNINKKYLFSKIYIKNYIILNKIKNQFKVF